MAQKIFDKADASIIRSYLKDFARNVNIETVGQIDSTNDEMKKQAFLGKEEISILIAESQTKGRGTKGRVFFSPDNTGCYMSFLLRPTYTPEECTLLTTAAACAVAEAIEKVTHQKAQIKWVNDIYINRKKVAGILTEASIAKGGKSLEYAVVGIGINIGEPQGGFPDEIKDIATSAIGESDAKIKNRLIAEVIGGFVGYYFNLQKKEFIGNYRDRLFFLGEEITVTEGDNSYAATAMDIDDMCRLIVKTADGAEKKLFGGEITIRPKN